MFNNSNKALSVTASKDRLMNINERGSGAVTRAPTVLWAPLVEPEEPFVDFISRGTRLQAHRRPVSQLAQHSTVR